ncbi:hypothetical protein Nepgr_019370 [Nepenthes gracilis]|uniref:Methyltransferase domain-containing protein n=1 Tax=Nepenthes gracilis TaxID=150966 RepID=A0AAD3SV85_NEPGR|nr:hypothetical protein Nepgr_019370 [Nepenthes gracilis]
MPRLILDGTSSGVKSRRLIFEMEGQPKYSCNSAAETLEWIQAIVDFLQSYRFFFDTHVVNFFKDRLWETVDKDWLDCLRNEPVEHLLQIPSGFVKDYWPASLKKFILTSRSLAFSREQVKMELISHDICVTPLNTVLAQGMNPKKKHEVEVLAAVVSSIARKVAAHVVVDVGAGQGYLAQVLSFQYQLAVVAIDASYHHGIVTNARAERIKKYYAAKIRKSGSGKGNLNILKTVTCRVLSSSMLRNLSNFSCQKGVVKEPKMDEGHDVSELNLPCNVLNADGASFVLAGLHACGDLSVTMLREGFKSTGFTLGKSARDLACQSAERWKGLEEDFVVQNFELHAFRAVFQMVLCRFYPEVLSTNPAIGRQGKALRRQERRRIAGYSMRLLGNGKSDSKLDMDSSHDEFQCKLRMGGERCYDNLYLFEKFCNSGLSHLGLEPVEYIGLQGLWKEFEHFIDLIGPYWSLRAAVGPLLETLVLLDRLLFLQEHCASHEVVMLPIFDPLLSPRNLAIIATKI